MDGHSPSITTNIFSFPFSQIISADHYALRSLQESSAAVTCGQHNTL